jgi:dUTPase
MSNLNESYKAHVREMNEHHINSFYRDEMVNDYAVLKLAVDSSLPQEKYEYLVQTYTQHIEKHNAELKNTEFPNAGFDLFVPDAHAFAANDITTKFLNLGIKCEMIFCKKSVSKYINVMRNKHSNGSEVVVDDDDDDEIGLSYHTGFFLYPRSSISKTPLMLANHTGIIDSGYRGNMIAAVRSLGKDEYEVEPGTRLFQIVSPTMCPVYAVLVHETDLTTTERGAGGFGSTGK